jgi:hypothetical protein
MAARKQRERERQEGARDKEYPSRAHSQWPTPSTRKKKLNMFFFFFISQYLFVICPLSSLVLSFLL